MNKITAYLLSSITIGAIFFGGITLSVLLDDEEEIRQLNESVQYIGAQHNYLESKIAAGLCLERLE